MLPHKMARCFLESSSVSTPACQPTFPAALCPELFSQPLWLQFLQASLRSHPRGRPALATLSRTPPSTALSLPAWGAFSRAWSL